MFRAGISSTYGTNIVQYFLKEKIKYTTVSQLLRDPLHGFRKVSTFKQLCNIQLMFSKILSFLNIEKPIFSGTSGNVRSTQIIWLFCNFEQATRVPFEQIPTVSAIFLCKSQKPWTSRLFKRSSSLFYLLTIWRVQTLTVLLDIFISNNVHSFQYCRVTAKFK